MYSFHEVLLCKSKHFFTLNYNNNLHLYDKDHSLFLVYMVFYSFLSFCILNLMLTLILSWILCYSQNGLTAITLRLLIRCVSTALQFVLDSCNSVKSKVQCKLYHPDKFWWDCLVSCLPLSFHGTYVYTTLW